MNRMLFINACVRPNSRTRRLAQGVLEQGIGVVTEINLEKEHLQPLNQKRLKVCMEGSAANDFSNPLFRYAKQFACADEIVMAAPCWDLSFPSLLRVYLEAVAVNNITFRYTENGMPQGLCQAHKLTYVTTAGGPIGSCDFGFPYIRALAQNLFGINKVEYLKAENLDIRGNNPEEILERAIKESFMNRPEEIVK